VVVLGKTTLQTLLKIRTQARPVSQSISYTIDHIFKTYQHKAIAMPPKVLVHGSGAIGAVYIYLLLQAGCSVTAVCRSNYTAAKANGFTLDSDRYGQGIKIHPNVVQTPEEAASQGPFDFIIVSTKALPGQKLSTPSIIKPAITSDKTTIVLIQNGIGIEDEYATAFPSNPLLSCVVYLPTTQISPGHISTGAIELLQIGTFPAAQEVSSPAKHAAFQLQSLLASAGGNAELHADIQAQRWSKLLINASWNPICALTLSRDVAFLASSAIAEKLVTDVMNEVVAIAQAKGDTNVTSEMARGQLQRALERKGTKGIEPSMLVDVVNGRRMEVEVILGNPIKVANEVGVSVPRMETLYVLLKALDEAMALREPGKSLGG
jgi:2-dehydropantoate 2-reductase